MARYRELEAFTQFASDLDKATQQQLNRGAHLVEVLKQPQYQPMPEAEQVIILWAAINGYIDDLPLERVSTFEAELLTFMRDRYHDVIHQITKEGAISDETRREMEQVVREFKAQFGQ